MINQLYQSHVEEKLAVFQRLLQLSEFDGVLLGSGNQAYYFRDDINIPFKNSAYFAEWVPISAFPGCYLLVAADSPLLLVPVVEDFWHSPPAPLPEEVSAVLRVQHYRDISELKPLLEGKAMAFVGDQPPLEGMAHNPAQLLDGIDYHRAYKSAYQRHCIAEANRIAVAGHQAAIRGFFERGSELTLHHDYLRAINHTEAEMPYHNIVALNENAAVLHHNHYEKMQPAQHRTLLVDAGAYYKGYCADITRTTAFDAGNDFAAMIAAMDAEQMGIISMVKADMSFVELHREAHRGVARTLAAFDLIKVSAEEAYESGITRTFLPHGLGHLLGVQVHDKGGYLANESGAEVPPVDDFPTLRLRRDIAPNQVFTVEPGLYFIPMLLDKLRATASDKVNWSRVEQFIPFGGIRIEDNVSLNDDGSIANYTRDAFAAHR